MLVVVHAGIRASKSLRMRASCLACFAVFPIAHTVNQLFYRSIEPRLSEVLILGMPWLVHYNPVVDWRGATVSFVDQHSRACVLRRIATGVAPWRPASSSSSRSSSSSPPSFSAARSSVRPSSNSAELNLITVRELKRSHRKDLIEFACLVYPQLAFDEFDSSTVPASAAHSNCLALPTKSKLI